MKPILVTKRNLLRLQKLPPHTRLLAFKVARGDGSPPFMRRSKIRYRVGRTYRFAHCNTDTNDSCGQGLHLATLAWVQDYWTGYSRNYKKVFMVTCQVKDIGCVPTMSDYNVRTGGFKMKSRGKFRVRKFRILRRVDWNGHPLA